MGKFTAASQDWGTDVTEGDLTAPGSTGWKAIQGRANVFVTGSFTGTAHLEASFDGGATAVSVTLADGRLRTITGVDRLVIDEPERGILYRLVATSLSAGTLHWRFSA